MGISFGAGPRVTVCKCSDKDWFRAKVIEGDNHCYAEVTGVVEVGTEELFEDLATSGSVHCHSLCLALIPLVVLHLLQT